MEILLFLGCCKLASFKNQNLDTPNISSMKECRVKLINVLEPYSHKADSISKPIFSSNVKRKNNEEDITTKTKKSKSKEILKNRKTVHQESVNECKPKFPKRYSVCESKLKNDDINISYSSSSYESSSSSSSDISTSNTEEDSDSGSINFVTDSETDYLDSNNESDLPIEKYNPNEGEIYQAFESNSTTSELTNFKSLHNHFKNRVTSVKNVNGRRLKYYALVKTFILNTLNTLHMEDSLKVNIISHTNSDQTKVLEDVKKLINEIKKEKPRYKFFDFIDKNTQNTKVYKDLEESYNEINIKDFTNRLDDSTLFALSRIVSKLYNKLEVKNDEKILAIVKYFVFNKIVGLKDGIESSAIHLPFLYNMADCDSHRTIRNLLYIALFIKTYFKDGKFIKLDKTDYLFYIAFYIKTFRSYSKTNNLSNNSPFVIYFYKIINNLEKSGSNNQDIKELVMSFYGRMVPEILFDRTLVSYKGSYANFKDIIDSDVETIQAYKQIFEVSETILKNQQSIFN